MAREGASNDVEGGVEMEIKLYSKHHIDSVVQNNEGSSWRYTGVYGNPKIEER